MNRGRLLLLGAMILVGGIVVVVMWLLDVPLSMPRLPSLGRSAPLPPAHIILIALVAGLMGGIIANLLGLGLRRHIGDIESRLSKVEGRGGLPSRDHAASRANQSGLLTSLRDGDPRGNQGYWQPNEDDEDSAPSGLEERLAGSDAGRGAATPTPDRRQDGAPPGGTPAPAGADHLIGEIVAGYSKIATGPLSRAAFQDFFQAIGPAEPVEVIDKGQSIRASDNSEAFLTSVQFGGRMLVFPSYSFIANCDTQFATIAGVPDDVASLFTLSRGSGEVVVAQPAIFSLRAGVPSLETSGEIKGFAG